LRLALRALTLVTMAGVRAAVREGEEDAALVEQGATRVDRDAAEIEDHARPPRTT
jgi:hypothetical protein